MNFIIFASIFLTVFAILSFYISKRFIKRLDFKTKTKKQLNFFLIFNFFGVILYMISRYQISVPNSLYFLFSLSIGVIFLLFITTLFYELFHLLIKLTPENESRRNLFKRSLDISSVALAGGITTTATYNAKEAKLEHVQVSIKNLKKEFRVVQLSDVHVGGLIEKDFIANIVQRVNNINPDIVVITGDLIDTDLSYIKDALQELGKLSSSYGTYFVVGNHEYFHKIEKIIPYINSLGIKVLENENIYIGPKDEGFNLVGVYDLFGYRYGTYKPDLNKALQKRQNGPTLLLAHQPKYINELKSIHGVDLVLSGHTHGGQIFPFKYLVKLAQPYIKGLHQHNKSTQIYVNKGTGFWGPPMRLGASAEITDIKLIPA